jgi:transposase
VVTGKKLAQEIRSFGTTTPDLLALRDWLTTLGVTHVAMESTGVYWKAPYYMLEDEFEVLLANATHLKHVPGRKTDVIDAEWIAELVLWTVAAQFRAAAGVSGVAGCDPVSQGADPGADGRGEPAAQGA